MYGFPKDLWEPFRKIKKKGEPIHEPLKGYEDCSPQFQAYMRKQGKKNDQKLLISELKSNKDISKEERKALLKKLAKKRVDQLKSEKQEPADRSFSSEIYGKRGGRFRYRTSKNGKLYRQYY